MLKVVQIGVGALGREIVRFALERAGVEIVAAVDPAPDKVGRDLGKLCSKASIGVKIR